MTAPELTTAAELQQQIERTRERLGATVEELAAKADVKTRVQDKAMEVKASALAGVAEVSERIRRSQKGQPRWPLGMTAAGVLMIAAALVWKCRQA
jgi:Protein of unknown function (DUF3618)